MLRKIPILVTALFFLLGLNSPQARSANSASTRSATSSTRSPARSRLTSHTRRVRRARRYRRRVWSPWRVSSFADPAATDNPAGEDPAARQAAMEALSRWNGSVVVVDPNNGRILSIVNQKLALSSAFTPCSTFKPVVALAALKDGILSTRTKLYAGRRTRMNVTEALAHSSNPFFAKLGQMLGFRRVAHYAHEFGLGEKTGWNIPGEAPGRFPNAPPPEGGVGLLTSFGQDIEVTPLQMAALISAIANGGTLYFLQYPRSAEEVADYQPMVRRHLSDLAEYLPDVRQGLAAAVLYGTGRLAYDPEEPIFGKTGTCSQDGARLGWFVSYAGESPKYVVVVLLRGGRQMYGPHAAEIAGRVYRELYDLEKTPTAVRTLLQPPEQLQR